MEQLKKRNGFNWPYTCKILHDIFSKYPDRIPNKMLKEHWPDNDPDIWRSGDKISFIDFTYHDGDESVSMCMDTDFHAIPWAAFPALFSSSKLQLKHVAIHKFPENQSALMETGIENSFPYAIELQDWGEDDNLEVFSCFRFDWDKTMNFENGLIRDRIEGFIRHNYDSFDLFIGIYDGDRTEIRKQPVIDHKVKETIDALKKTIENIKNDGYIPLILQTVEDGDGDNAGAIYWMAKNSGE